MNKEYKVVYKCQDCGKEFKVKWGSRRRFCDECTLKRVLNQKP